MGTSEASITIHKHFLINMEHIESQLTGLRLHGMSRNRTYYSVPFIHIGQQASVIYTRTIVSVFVKGERAEMHCRDYRKGRYTTAKEHLCSTHEHYLDHSPDYYMQKAKAISHDLYQLFEQLFQRDKYPEQACYTCDGILRIQRNSDAAEFSKACKMAIEYQKYTYGFIRNMLKNKMTQQQENAIKKSLPNHENSRGFDYYSQTYLN